MTKDDVVVRWDTADTLILANGTLPLRLERFRLATRRRELIRTIGPANAVGVIATFNPVLAADPNVYAYTLVRQLSQLFLVQGAR